MPFVRFSVGQKLEPERKEISAAAIGLFLARIQEGFTLTAAARALSFSPSQLKELISKKISEADLDEAMRIGAETLIDEASEALRLADTKEDVEKAKALAQHYRWLASKLNKRKFGESVKVDGAAAPSYEFNLIFSGSPTPSEKLVSERRNVIEHKP